MSEWPMKYRFWHWVNGITAKLAWKYADPGGPDRGKALRINNKHPLWQLNKWAGGRWIPWWMEWHRREK